MFSYEDTDCLKNTQTRNSQFIQSGFLNMKFFLFLKYSALAEFQNRHKPTSGVWKGGCKRIRLKYKTRDHKCKQLTVFEDIKPDFPTTIIKISTSIYLISLHFSRTLPFLISANRRLIASVMRTLYHFLKRAKKGDIPFTQICQQSL